MGMIPRVKGTQDTLNMRTINLFLEITKKYLTDLAFCEITTPLIEHADLFLRTLGNETDVVSKQMYMITTHDQEKVCLRPEATASSMRAYLEAHITQAPWRVFTYGPMFRYERPQRGRYRQFNQLSMEIINAASVAYDASFIASLSRLFTQHLQLTDFDLCINFLGCSSDRASYKKILRDFLEGKTVCATCDLRKEKNILRIFDCKNSDCQTLYAQAPHLTDSLCTTCGSEWSELRFLLDQFALSYKHIPTLVRGLDYYNKTVFEFTSNHLGSQNAFCSGGRYDGLAQELGSQKEVPAVGAAMGMERIVLMLESQDRFVTPIKAPLCALIPMDKQLIAPLVQIATQLSNAQIVSELIFDGDSLKSKMRKANLLKADYVLLMGSREAQEKEIVLKDMATGLETSLAQATLIEHLQKLFKSNF